MQALTQVSLTLDHASSQAHATKLARNILAEVMKHRRTDGPNTTCSAHPCQNCASLHHSKVAAAIAQRQPITFVLPAFPGKSPNPAKVLGPLPDMAEQHALEFLQLLCDRIRRHYAPGARIILCSDGRVFSDVVGMRDEDVTAYQDELSRMVAELKLTSLSTFNLEKLYEGLSFDQMRGQLMTRYGAPIEALKASVSRGGKASGGTQEDVETNRLYCGITRFLVEDASFPGQTKSRTAIQKECRARAYEVIQRSKAWGELVEAAFPSAVRLSIHPQSCGAKKLGIRLIEPDNWQTPWHGVAVEVSGRMVLLKRSQAEALGAKLMYRGGRPSHYVLTAEHAIPRLQGASHES